MEAAPSEEFTRWIARSKRVRWSAPNCSGRESSASWREGAGAEPRSLARRSDYRRAAKSWSDTVHNPGKYLMSIRLHDAFGMAISVGLLSTPAMAAPFVFSTGSVTDQIATASRTGPASGANQETESADDFALKTDTRINSATFTGLLPARASVDQVTVEIYRVFPN